MRCGRRHRIEAVLDGAADQVSQHRARALVGHVDRLDLGGQHKHLQCQVLRAAGAGRTKADLARLGAAQLDQILHGFGRLAFVADQQVGRDTHQHNRLEVFGGVIVDLLQGGRDGLAVDVRHQQRVAVAGLLGHIVGGDGARRACLVLDDDLRLPQVTQLLADDPSQNVRAATGCEAHDDTDGSIGQRLRD